MRKRRVMIDGFRMGAELRGGVELSQSEVSVMRDILIKADAKDEDGEGLCIGIQGETVITVGLRRHYHDKNRYFLNIWGNPCSFLCGSNEYGYVEADRVIITAFREALEALGKGVPERIYKAIADREIHMYFLEFAVYTNPVPAKTKLLNDWHHMYNASYTSKDGISHETLLDMLDLKLAKKHKTHKSSLALKIMSRCGSEEQAMLLCYDKAKQMEQDASKEGCVAMIPADVKNRLRLDLHLHHGWFRKRRVNNKKLQTLRDLTEYIAANFEGSWLDFVRCQFDWALQRTYLFEMWAFDAVKCIEESESNEIYDALALTRDSLSLSDEQRKRAAEARQNGTKLQIKTNRNPHPEKLELDYSKL